METVTIRKEGSDPLTQDGEIVTIERGFFFIRGQDEKEYFAHKSNLQQHAWIYEIQLGDSVTFTPTVGRKGPSADHVIVHRLNN